MEILRLAASVNKDTLTVVAQLAFLNIPCSILTRVTFTDFFIYLSSEKGKKLTEDFNVIDPFQGKRSELRRMSHEEYFRILFGSIIKLVG